MTPGELAAIAARANAATEGPWIPSKADGSWGVHYPGNVCAGPRPQIITTGANSANTQFIAHAREDIPALLAVLRDRNNTIAKVRAVHQPRVNSTSALWPKPLCTCNSTYPCATIAALDPQETPDGRM